MEKPTTSAVLNDDTEAPSVTFGLGSPGVGLSWVSKKRATVTAVIVASIGSFGLGTVLTWSAIATKSIKESAYFGVLEDSESSWIASLALLGALISAPFTGFLMSAIGRRKTMLLTAIPCLLGWLLIVFAQNISMLYCGRFITGFCGGAFTVAIPAYVSEVTEDSIRGTLGTVMILMLCTGIEFTYIVGAFVDWFILSIICAFVPVIFFISMLFMPESPRYLLIKQNPIAARQALQWLRRASTKKHIEPEVCKIQTSVEASAKESSKFADLFTPSVLKPVGISIALMFFGQLSGVNGISLYTVMVFEDAGTQMDGRVASIIIGGCQVLTVLFVPFVLIETLGRKTLMIVSEVIMILGLGAFGAFYYLKENMQTDLEAISWLPLTSLVTVIIGYNIGMGPVPWVVISEILPSHVKASASSVITVFYWSLAFLAGKTFPSLGQLLGNAGLYWLCTGVCILGVGFISYFVPETKGKSTEEIHSIFGHKPCSDSESSPYVEVQGTSSTVDLNFSKQTPLNESSCSSEVSGGLDNPAFSYYGSLKC